MTASGPARMVIKYNRSLWRNAGEIAKGSIALRNRDVGEQERLIVEGYRNGATDIRRMMRHYATQERALRAGDDE